MTLSHCWSRERVVVIIRAFHAAFSSTIFHLLSNFCFHFAHFFHRHEHFDGKLSAVKRKTKKKYEIICCIKEKRHVNITLHSLHESLKNICTLKAFQKACHQGKSNFFSAEDNGDFCFRFPLLICIFHNMFFHSFSSPTEIFSLYTTSVSRMHVYGKIAALFFIFFNILFQPLKIWPYKWKNDNKRTLTYLHALRAFSSRGKWKILLFVLPLILKYVNNAKCFLFCVVQIVDGFSREQINDL